MEKKYITLAIHTYTLATALRQMLEKHGVPVQLENVNIANPEPGLAGYVCVSLRTPSPRLCVWWSNPDSSRPRPWKWNSTGWKTRCWCR